MALVSLNEDLSRVVELVRSVADDPTTTYKPSRTRRRAENYRRYKARLATMREAHGDTI